MNDIITAPKRFNYIVYKIFKAVKWFVLLVIVVFIIYQKIKVKIVESYTSPNGENIVTVLEIGSSLTKNPHLIEITHNKTKLLSFVIETDIWANFIPPTIEWLDNNEFKLSCQGDEDVLTFHIKLDGDVYYIDWQTNWPNGEQTNWPNGDDRDAIQKYYNIKVLVQSRLMPKLLTIAL